MGSLKPTEMRVYTVQGEELQVSDITLDLHKPPESMEKHQHSLFGTQPATVPLRHAFGRTYLTDDEVIVSDR